jgi:dTMP kinase
VCDRFFDSTTAYQGYGRELPLDQVVRLNQFATSGLVPDLTIVLDLDPAEGLIRATGGGADRLEAEEPAFHERVREGFLSDRGGRAGAVVVVPTDRVARGGRRRVQAAVRSLPVLAAVLH